MHLIMHKNKENLLFDPTEPLNYKLTFSLFCLFRWAKEDPEVVSIVKILPYPSNFSDGYYWFRLVIEIIIIKSINYFTSYLVLVEIWQSTVLDHLLYCYSNVIYF